MSQWCGDMTPHYAHPDAERLGQYCIGNMPMPPPSPMPKIGRPSDSIGPIMQVDFKSNPAMAKPFRDWGDSGAMWTAFAEWYLDNKDKYEQHQEDQEDQAHRRQDSADVGPAQEPEAQPQG